MNDLPIRNESAKVLFARDNWLKMFIQSFVDFDKLQINRFQSYYQLSPTFWNE